MRVDDSRWLEPVDSRADPVGNDNRGRDAELSGEALVTSTGGKLTRGCLPDSDPRRADSPRGFVLEDESTIEDASKGVEVLAARGREREDIESNRPPWPFLAAVFVVEPLLFGYAGRGTWISSQDILRSASGALLVRWVPPFMRFVVPPLPGGPSISASKRLRSAGVSVEYTSRIIRFRSWMRVCIKDASSSRIEVGPAAELAVNSLSNLMASV